MYSKPNSNPTSKNNSDKSAITQKKSNPKTKNKANTIEICAVCLNELNDDFAVLNCKHKFCSVQCARGWWKFNENCPYCRQEISFIQSADGQKISFDQISQKSSEDDQDFIPRCVQCWADIDENQEKKTCHICSSNFIHKRCVMFHSRFWRCHECIENVDENEREIYPIIPYNPIIHFLMINNFKE